MILGCIADDVTGATDLALMLSKNGMRVLQILGVPSGDAPSNSDAIVIALKTRTAQKNSAVNKSVESAKWLKEAGARQFFIRYCSTFDSTEEGNIGPVSEALLDFLESSFTVVCPAFPENSRTVYMGHLFVHGQLLSESSMKDHPLTPMRDANLIRFLGKQLSDANSVGLISIGTVTLGPSAIRSRINELKQDGYRFAVIDAIEDKHLLSIADACSEMKLITGGSAVAMGLPGNYRRSGILPIQSSPLEMPKLLGPVAILSGSCSTATQEQISNLSEKVEGIFLDPISLENGGEEYFKSLLGQVELALSQGVVLVYSTSSPDKVGMIQASLGKNQAEQKIEEAFARLAGYLQNRNVQNYIIAGGETSAVIAEALNIRKIYIGPEIDPGVPWTVCYEHKEPVLLAFKSGNFGKPDFFIHAMEMLK